MKGTLSALALMAAAMLWVREKFAAGRLQAELAECRVGRAELEAQRQEQARLLALQPASDELAALQTAIAARNERRRALEAGQRERRNAEERGLRLGEWLPQEQVQDRGQGTPAATVQTMLWAAAGGELARLGGILHFDAAARARLDQLYAALPAATRARYASPEQLVAAFTTKAVPLGAAQLVWQQQTRPDEAAACIWVTHPAAASQPETPVVTPAGKAPSLPASTPPRSQALLTLRRFDDGWRVSVPVTAIDQLARELGAERGR